MVPPSFAGAKRPNFGITDWATSLMPIASLLDAPLPFPRRTQHSRSAHPRFLIRSIKAVGACDNHRYRDIHTGHFDTIEGVDRLLWAKTPPSHRHLSINCKPTGMFRHAINGCRTIIDNATGDVCTLATTRAPVFTARMLIASQPRLLDKAISRPQVRRRTRHSRRLA